MDVVGRKGIDTGEYSLTESAFSPFQAEPTQLESCGQVTGPRKYGGAGSLVECKEAKCVAFRLWREFASNWTMNVSAFFNYGRMDL